MAETDVKADQSRRHQERERLSIPDELREIRGKEVAGDIPGSLGTGGMLSKIKAAKKVTAAGVPMVIANGNVPDILEKLFDGGSYGTFFVPGDGRQKIQMLYVADVVQSVRSALSADNLRRMGYENPISLDGGWSAWSGSGMPVER